MINTEKINKKILVISPHIFSNTGGGVINQRNIDILHELSNDITIYYINANEGKSTRGQKINERLNGFIAGLNVVIFQEIKNMMSDILPDIVFVNQSFYGPIARLAKRMYPQSKVITFFHNIESIYFSINYMNNLMQPIALLNSVIAYKTERLAVKYSDHIIVMNQRDGKMLNRIYGRNADLLLPTSLRDNKPIDYCCSTHDSPLELLFVGYNFFANIHGLKWFCKNVMPKVSNAHFTIVGREMDLVKDQFEASNVDVFGYVEDIKEYYSKTDIVVNPVFIGSGMKTKTAEAFMYGLPILATKEALEGYDIDPDLVGAKCETADEFIAKINYYTSNKNELTQKAQNSRLVFEQNYSHEISAERLITFINSIPKHKNQ